MAQVTPEHWITEAQDPAEWQQRLNARSAADEVTGCVNWTGRLDRKGYGVFIVGHGQSRRFTGAHRAAWLTHRGPISRGLVIDHLCRNRACVNVEHMEVVTPKVNTMRGDAGRQSRPLKTHCIHGHEFTPENTRTRSTPTRRLVRDCRACARDRRQRSQDAA